MKITSMQNSFIKELVQLKNKKHRDEQELFLIDDFDLLEVARQKGILQWILACDTSRIKSWLPEGKVIEVTPEIIDKLADVNSPNGFIGVCSYFDNQILYPQMIIALDGVQDPGNGGAIIRSAHAFGFDQVLLSDVGFDRYNPKFIRASKGSIFAIPCQRVALYERILLLKKAGYQVIVAAKNQHSCLLENCQPKRPFVLVVGSEGQGVSDAIVQIADFQVMIPIHAEVESLNVGVASAILMYYLNQRR